MRAPKAPADLPITAAAMRSQLGQRDWTLTDLPYVPASLYVLVGPTAPASFNLAQLSEGPRFDVDLPAEQPDDPSAAAPDARPK